jgi:hypothetical protein
MRQQQQKDVSKQHSEEKQRSTSKTRKAGGALIVGKPQARKFNGLPPASRSNANTS